MTRQERIQQKRLELVETQMVQRKMMLELGRLDAICVQLAQDICSLEIACFEEDADKLRSEVRKVGQ